MASSLSTNRCQLNEIKVFIIVEATFPSNFQRIRFVRGIG